MRWSPGSFSSTTDQNVGAERAGEESSGSSLVSKLLTMGPPCTSLLVPGVTQSPAKQCLKGYFPSLWGPGEGEQGTEDTPSLQEVHLKRWVEDKWDLGLFLAFNALVPPCSFSYHPLLTHLTPGLS